MSGPDRIWAGLAGGTHYWVSDEYAARSFEFTTEYIRRDPAVLVALPEVQALTAAAEARALDSVTTLHMVIADIRAATVGSKPMLSELAQALVAWRDEAVRAEREACVAECQHRASQHENNGHYLLMREVELCAAAIRKRGEG